MVKRNFREGFTLIELSLSIVFVSILSLTIVLIITNTVKAYQRGLILNQVNTVGMDIVDDMRLAIQNASTRSSEDYCLSVYANSSDPINLCKNDGAYNFVSVTRSGTVTMSGKKIGDNIPLFGAFCTGTYSYLWNSGYFNAEGAKVEGTGRATFTYKNSSGSTVTNSTFRLLKVRDDSRAVCTSAVFSNGTNYKISGLAGGVISNKFNITKFANVPEDPVDLLILDGSGSDRSNNDLALYDLEVPRPAEDKADSNVFYSVSFILGTLRGGINIRANGKNCATPSDLVNENFNYCAINKFNFAAQASGE